MLTKIDGHRLAKSALIIALILMLAALATPVGAYFAPSNGQAATLVLGQPNFTSNTAHITRTGMSNPASMAVDPTTHKVFVAENDNNRVLRFASVYALTNGAPAEAVLGQPNFTSNASATTQAGMFEPWGVYVDAAGRLWVADKFNDRVLRFDHASTLSSGANANGVLGQPDFTSYTQNTTRNGMDSPSVVFVDTGGRLWVGDWINNRILRFDNAATKPNHANADGVLGQIDFTSSGSATTRSGMHLPAGVFVDAGGRLWVGDSLNNRVLRFDNAASKTNGQNADGVLGQPDFTSSGSATTRSGMYCPSGVAVDNSSGQLYVSDACHNRILVFNSAAALPNGANASFVLGQTNFTTGTGNTPVLSAASLDDPEAVFYDPVAKVLWAADLGNNRVLMYGKSTRYSYSLSAAGYDGWVLESTENSEVGGSKNAAGTLRLGDDASNRQYRSLLYFNTSALPGNAVIRSVTLKIKKAGAVGTNPLATFGYLLADIKKGTFGASSLEITDFQTHASANAIGYFSALASEPGWYQLVLPAADYKYINLAGATQFRLRFTKDDNNNHIADYVSFYAGDATTTANRPILTVEYTLP